ncbi:hypothetical protein [Ottowia thiooxydans]|uniref:Post-segregation antitoxin (Ccd killing protein) n=1 Tax=Ottowia thiooxydans TaxID=219182 RepID=A0ABV2QDR4_9BURK
MASKMRDPAASKELLLQMTEVGMGVMAIYSEAIACTDRPSRKARWQACLSQAKRHQEILSDLCQAAGIDPNEGSAGRTIARHLNESLLTSMKMAIAIGDTQTVGKVTCECVLLAETRRQQTWALLGQASCMAPGPLEEAMNSRVQEAAIAQLHQLHQTSDWMRESWAESLGLPLIKAAASPKDEAAG